MNMGKFVQFVSLVEANVYRQNPAVNKIKDKFRTSSETEKLFHVWKSGVEDGKICTVAVDGDNKNTLVKNFNSFLVDCGRIYGMDRAKIPTFKLYDGMYDAVMEKNFGYFTGMYNRGVIRGKEIPLIAFNTCSSGLLKEHNFWIEFNSQW